MNTASMTTEAVVNPEPEKVNLLGLSPEGLGRFFDYLGEKPFRATQVMKWIHQLGAENFDAMTNISKDLRERLKAVAEIRAPEVVSRQDSEDGTRKWLIRVDGGSCVETVFIPESDRGTLCVSSQAGCSLNCSFCATGKEGFNRNLSAAEIIGQVWIAAKSFGSLQPKAPRVVTNVVFMGMGEPLLNFSNVVNAIRLMLHDNAYGLSKRRVTLSTSGVVPELDRLAKYVDVSLAISMHAPNDELRDQLVPINRKYPIAALLESARRYLAQMPDVHRKITVGYTLIKGVNDRPEHAVELTDLLRILPCKINLIPFNQFANSEYRRVTNESLNCFRDILHRAGYTVTIRSPRGDDIAAACGQLAGQVMDRTRRSERYLRIRAESPRKQPAGIVGPQAAGNSRRDAVTSNHRRTES